MKHHTSRPVNASCRLLNRVQRLLISVESAGTREEKTREENTTKKKNKKGRTMPKSSRPYLYR
jgi:hypothetical protein